MILLATQHGIIVSGYCVHALSVLRLVTWHIVCCDLGFTICRSSQSNPSHATVLWVTCTSNGSEGSQNAWAAQLVWKAHLCSVRESSQETGVEQFPDHETSATWLLVDVEMSYQMAPGGHRTHFIWGSLKHIRVVREKSKHWNTSEEQWKLDVFESNLWKLCD